MLKKSVAMANMANTAKSELIPLNRLTTSEKIEGLESKETLGLVFGVGHQLFGFTKDNAKNAFVRAVAQLRAHATTKNADAVVSIKITSTSSGFFHGPQTVTIVGTAVKTS